MCAEVNRFLQVLLSLCTVHNVSDVLCLNGIGRADLLCVYRFQPQTPSRLPVHVSLPLTPFIFSGQPIRTNSFKPSSVAFFFVFVSGALRVDSIRWSLIATSVLTGRPRCADLACHAHLCNNSAELTRMAPEIQRWV
jgi:hypothetical protein